MALHRIKFNIGGQVFLTKKTTLEKIPGTKLANYQDTCEYYDSNTDEYYYDRSPLIFQPILEYYRTGRLHFTTNMCAEQIREELEFWEISTCGLKPCCWKNFYSLDSDMQTAGVIERHFVDHCSSSLWPKHSKDKLKKNVWNFLENPRVSRFAFVRF